MDGGTCEISVAQRSQSVKGTINFGTQEIGMPWR